jgi:hypothetical protein
MTEVSSDRASKEADASVMISGRLVPLKTALETGARDSLLSVYVTSVPAKSASTVLRSVYDPFSRKSTILILRYSV